MSQIEFWYSFNGLFIPTLHLNIFSIYYRALQFLIVYKDILWLINVADFKDRVIDAAKKKNPDGISPFIRTHRFSYYGELQRKKQ